MRGGASVFDSITCNDLILAFFPCIYFSCMSQMEMSWGCHNYKGWTTRMKTDNILRRSKQRERFLELAIKMLTIAEERGLRLIMENPWSQQTYLKAVIHSCLFSIREMRQNSRRSMALNMTR